MMSRKSFVLAIFIVIFLTGGAGAGAVFLIRHEPAFYKRCALPEGPQFDLWANEFDQGVINGAGSGILSEWKWHVEFNENQINAFLASPGLLLKYFPNENPWPPGVSQPRVNLGNDRIRLGFRYGRGRFSTVISVEMRVWLSGQEPNVMAFEILSMYAGAVPISAQSLLEHMGDSARQQKIDVSFYRFNKHPVLLLRFQADRTTPTFQLRQFKTEQGTVHIGGGPTEKPKG
jgi:hypothetical protein